MAVHMRVHSTPEALEKILNVQVHLCCSKVTILTFQHFYSGFYSTSDALELVGKPLLHIFATHLCEGVCVCVLCICILYVYHTHTHTHKPLLHDFATHLCVSV